MKKRSRQSGKVSFWDLVIVVLVVVLGYLLYIRGYLDRYLPKPVAPITQPVAEPTPTVKRSEPESTPAPTPSRPAFETSSEPASTPAASETEETSRRPASTEKPIVLEEVERRFWPVQVKLLKQVEFPIVANGQQVGSANAPAGMMLTLVGIRGDQVEVQNGQMSKVIPAADTDIFDRVRMMMRAVSNMPAAASTPVAGGTPWKPQLRGVH